ncbi:C40 family peptidase [Cribrihabitans neustonicus]|uniref:C40 family peptidase n=1 Tax=Cribrihabitans neustonicus TaxID=1429085 RepID=UPI003B5BCDFC
MSGAELTAGAQARVALPVADLHGAPGGARTRQVLCGERVEILEEDGRWRRIRAAKDGYIGYLRTSDLAPPLPASHWVSAAATHAYTEAEFKSPERCGLSHGARVQVTGSHGRFLATDQGFIPAGHLSPLGTWASDPVKVAELFLGTPYLWGGNSRWGIDCSGLVQAALVACGLPCPGDSGPQEAGLGRALPRGTDRQRGDLLFWEGHVALVRDADTLIHANAHHMAVALEPLEAAIARIAAQGDGPVTAHKRLE